MLFVRILGFVTLLLELVAAAAPADGVRIKPPDQAYGRSKPVTFANLRETAGCSNDASADADRGVAQRVEPQAPRRTCSVSGSGTRRRPRIGSQTARRGSAIRRPRRDVQVVRCHHDDQKNGCPENQTELHVSITDVLHMTHQVVAGTRNECGPAATVRNSPQASAESCRMLFAARPVARQARREQRSLPGVPSWQSPNVRGVRPRVDRARNRRIFIQ